MALEKIDIDTLDPAATIVVATGNAHKLTEIEAILGKVMPEVRFVALGQLGDFEDPEENGTTFLENAHTVKESAQDTERTLPYSRINSVISLGLWIIDIVYFAHLFGNISLVNTAKVIKTSYLCTVF